MYKMWESILNVVEKKWFGPRTRECFTSLGVKLCGKNLTHINRNSSFRTWALRWVWSEAAWWSSYENIQTTRFPPLFYVNPRALLSWLNAVHLVILEWPVLWIRIRSKLKGRIRIRIKVKSQIRIKCYAGYGSASICRWQAKMYGIWAHFNTFSRFLAFIWKLGSGSALQWKADPDPHQIDADPQHWLRHHCARRSLCETFRDSCPAEVR